MKTSFKTVQLLILSLTTLSALSGRAEQSAIAPPVLPIGGEITRPIAPIPEPPTILAPPSSNYIGLFIVGPGIYYQNDNKHFCWFRNFHSFKKITGRDSAGGLMQMATFGNESTYDGACDRKYKQGKTSYGLFNVAGQIYYQNNQDRFCHIKDEADVRKLRLILSDIPRVAKSAMPKKSLSDGVCKVK